MFSSQASQVAAKGPLGEVIQIQIQTRSDRACEWGHLEFRRVQGEEQVNKMWRFEDPAGFGQGQRLDPIAVKFFRRQPAVGAHLAQDPFLAFGDAVKVGLRVQAGRRLGNRRQQRAFGRAQVRQGLGKVELRRGGGAAVQIAVVQPVEIFREDLLLAPDLFQAHGLQGFQHFRAERPWPGLRQLDQLLGDGRTA